MANRPSLVRRPDKGMIAGVAAGVAEAYDLDVTWVRVGFVALAVIFAPLGLAYLLAAVVMPPADDAEPGLNSARRNVDDLVGKGREFYGESRRVVEKVRGREVAPRATATPIDGGEARSFKPGGPAAKSSEKPFSDIDGASGI